MANKYVTYGWGGEAYGYGQLSKNKFQQNGKLLMKPFFFLFFFFFKNSSIYAQYKKSMSSITFRCEAPVKTRKVISTQEKNILVEHEEITYS